MHVFTSHTSTDGPCSSFRCSCSSTSTSLATYHRRPAHSHSNGDRVGLSTPFRGFHPTRRPGQRLSLSSLHRPHHITHSPHTHTHTRAGRGPSNCQIRPPIASHRCTMNDGRVCVTLSFEARTDGRTDGGGAHMCTYVYTPIAEGADPPAPGETRWTPKPPIWPGARCEEGAEEGVYGGQDVVVHNMEEADRCTLVARLVEADFFYVHYVNNWDERQTDRQRKRER
ncbi:hypothetical protein PYCCODRAFT_602567 [Trametes coccinea BRFM310]|uniref:Uncharacterized protein n=1 Tax=Trametes coccinea (strain BRFM310) TaxID=1353009 RepID=A0A1Y2J1U2_TRAC3|nr:hypothetical protein PYCCODRAFT_602567 [Trametes coccinea BRFM310]